MDKDVQICLAALVVCHLMVFVLANMECKPGDPRKLRKDETLRLSAFSSEQIVPDVVDSVPESVLDIVWRPGVGASLGNMLQTADVKDAPQTVSWIADGSKLYTLIAVDPDAPLRNDPKNREFQHWLVGNIPGGRVQKGDVYSEYRSPNPPAGSGRSVWCLVPRNHALSLSGPHRYVFMIFEQPGHISFDEPRFAAAPAPATPGAPSRSHFSTRQFVQKYKLGNLVAGNFFQLQN